MSKTANNRVKQKHFSHLHNFFWKKKTAFLVKKNINSIPCHFPDMKWLCQVYNVHHFPDMKWLCQVYNVHHFPDMKWLRPVYNVAKYVLAISLGKISFSGCIHQVDKTNTSKQKTSLIQINLRQNLSWTTLFGWPLSTSAILTNYLCKSVLQSAYIWEIVRKQSPTFFIICYRN